MKTIEIGFILLFKNDELCDFEKVSIEYSGSRNKINCLKKYCDLLAASNDIDTIYQFSAYTIEKLKRQGYEKTSDNGTFVYIDEETFKSLCGDNLTEEESVNILRKTVFEHRKLSISVMIEAFVQRKKQGLKIQEWYIDDNHSEIMSQEEFNKVMLELESIERALKLRQNPFEENTEFKAAVIEALNGISKAISSLKTTSTKDDLESKNSPALDLLALLAQSINSPTEMQEATKGSSSQKIQYPKLPPISTTVNNICKSVIGQDEAVKETVFAIYSNLDLITKNLPLSELIMLKNNVLMSGKSGCGKTEIARQIAANFNIPVLIEDIKPYTGAGWQGKELGEILKRMYLISNRNIAVAQRGVLVIDEIDKITIDKSNKGSSHNTLEVQQGLLKIIEGEPFEFDIGPSKKVLFDTSTLTVIGVGAFNGYNRNDGLSSEDKYFSKQDYIDYGLMPEFVRRFKTFITLKDLSFEDKKRILMESELSILKLKLADLRSRGININIGCTLDKLCEAIIVKSEQLSNGNCGASDLNEIAFNIFGEIYYRLYDGEEPTEITFDDSIVGNPKKMIFRR